MTVVSITSIEDTLDFSIDRFLTEQEFCQTNEKLYNFHENRPILLSKSDIFYLLQQLACPTINARPSNLNSV